MKIRFTRAIEVELHDVGSHVEPGSTDPRHLLPRGVYAVVFEDVTYFWMKSWYKRITYAIRRDMLQRAVEAGAAKLMEED